MKGKPPQRGRPPQQGPHDPGGGAAAARVVAAGGRVPKKFIKARPVSAGPTASAAEAMAKVSPARAAAFEILMLVGAGKGHSDELLHGSRTEALSPGDRNLATALVMGVLRWQIALDATVRGLLARPDQRLVEPVALALRMGAFQLLHMDRIPAHAALSESVEMCRAAGEPHAAGMVNAVLRKLAAPASSLRNPPEPKPSAAATLAERLAHPRWMVDRWIAAYGREAAEAICDYDQQEPGPGTIFAASSSDDRLPLIDDGSRLVAELAVAAMPVLQGRAVRVWDCCAAPGGKTLVIALRLAGAEGAEAAPEAKKVTEIVASDVSVRRLTVMSARLKKYPQASAVQCVVADVVSGDQTSGEFDLILCDVPCSGTGTMARNPEIRHRVSVDEFNRQAARQRAIVVAALARLAPGGRLVYSTCSLEAEENERVVEAAIAATGGAYRRVPVDGLIARLGPVLGEVGSGLVRSAVRGGSLRTLPGVQPCDGFFAVVLERMSEPTSDGPAI